MIIDTITCSGPHEDTPVNKLVSFMNDYSNVEIAIQASPYKMSAGTERYAWFNKLMRAVQNNPTQLNLALHVNQEWCDWICRGVLPFEIQMWLEEERPDGMPVVRRVQINSCGSKTMYFYPTKIAKIINTYPNSEFIVQNDGTVSSVRRLDKLNVTGANFSVLYDASSGNGIMPASWKKPYHGHKTGYSGGLRPDNVVANLRQIASVAGKNHIWIDAESGLKNPATKTFDINRARAYVDAVMRWQNTHER